MGSQKASSCKDENLEVIADLHVHSRFSRACSENITINAMDTAAKEKGLKIVGTGDFTHPLWLNEIKKKLVEAEDGLYKIKGSSTGTRFILSVEVSNVFEKDGKARKVHSVILAPSIEIVEQINGMLANYGNLSSDGRPTLNMSLAELVEILHGISDRIFVFPAHAWTPWYGVLGSSSGFDSIKEAYEDQEMHIHALETGLSSDPPMNWRVSSLDKYTLISNSDAHSLPKLGRESNVFEIEEGKLSYDEIISAITRKDRNKLKSTIEFYPEEGKYHYDGHRNCNVSLSPEAAMKFNDICPVCGKPLTIGVLHRVEELADRPKGFVPKDAIPFAHAVPLREVLAYIMKKGEATAAVNETYASLIEKFGSEFNVLLKATIEDIEGINKDLAKALENVRSEKVNLIPGYDGVFGIVDIMNRIKKKEGMQSSLSEF